MATSADRTHLVLTLLVLGGLALVILNVLNPSYVPQVIMLLGWAVIGPLDYVMGGSCSATIGGHGPTCEIGAGVILAVIGAIFLLRYLHRKFKPAGV